VITLDQQRAGFAWDKARAAKKQLPIKDFDKYRNLAKGAPALVMGSGVMAALAFWQSRKEAPAMQLVSDLLGWLADRKLIPSSEFDSSMTALTGKSSAEYLAITDETLAVLRWLRQCADAVAATAST
jgi:CRISPR-associated protein Cmr5